MAPEAKRSISTPTVHRKGGIVLSENTGKIVQVMGPVVDVEFTTGNPPAIKEALYVELPQTRVTMEVSQFVGNNTVRCIMLSPSEGLARGMTVVASGSSITAPVGEATLGRLFNVLGEAIDGKGPVNAEERWSIHRAAPKFQEQRPVVEIGRAHV